MRLLLGFGNKARQGKDSAARAIEDFNFGAPYYEIRIFKFAEALYDLCYKEYGMIEKDAPLLQRVGQEKRQQNPNYWIERLDFRTRTFEGIGIITDVRYQNEAEWIKSQGGFLINVTRLNEDGSQFIASDRPANHPSEIDLDNWKWDAYIKTYSDQEVLAGEQAITIANFFYQITEPQNV